MSLIEHKKARFDYEILEEFEAGLELLGHEVKALRQAQGKLEGAHVIIRGGEAYVTGMSIPPYQPKNTPKDYDPHQTRRGHHPGSAKAAEGIGNGQEFRLRAGLRLRTALSGACTPIFLELPFH